MTFSVGIPLFILGLAYLEWKVKSLRRQKIFHSLPFNQLEKIGFEKYFILVDTMFFFTEEIKIGFINDFFIECDTMDTKSIFFKPLIDMKLKNMKEVEYVENKLKQEGISDGLFKLYDIRQTRNKPIQQILIDLEKFTQRLKDYNIKSVSSYKV